MSGSASIRTGVIGALVAILAGCGAQSTVPTVSSAQSEAHRASSSGAAVLYATQLTGIAMYSFPNGSPLGMINLTGPWSVCTDSSGNVWAGTYDRYAYEYTHDGTGPIATIDTKTTSPITGCAVDPTTGNVALVYQSGLGIFQSSTWKGTQYALPLSAYRCGYDASGDLYADTVDTFELAELPKGQSAFHKIKLDRTALYAGGLVWDGTYMTIAATLEGHRHVVYRFKTTGTKGKVVQTVTLRDQWKEWPFAIYDGTLVAPTPHGIAVGYWRYPEGGKKYHNLNISGSQDLAVGVASNVPH